MALPAFPIPDVLYFINGNSFCGSHAGLNYRLTPVKTDDASLLHVIVWYGMNCSEKSEIAASAEFPLDRDGATAATAFIREQDAVFHGE